MSKLERQVEVKFRRQYAIKGDSIRVLAIPSDLDIYTEKEYEAINKAIGEELWVHDGDESGALVQLPGFHDYSWLPASVVERIR